MHHARRTTESQHRLASIGQGQVHRKQAELFMDHLGDLNAAQSKPLLQPLLEHVVGNPRCERQRGLLHEEQPIAEIHGIEKGWRFLALRRAEVIAAVIHQHKPARLDRCLGETAHHAVGGLSGHWPLIGPPDVRCARARGIDHQARPQGFAGCTGHCGDRRPSLHPFRAALMPAHPLSPTQPVALQSGPIKQAVVDSMDLAVILRR